MTCADPLTGFILTVHEPLCEAGRTAVTGVGDETSPDAGGGVTAALATESGEFIGTETGEIIGV